MVIDSRESMQEAVVDDFLALEKKRAIIIIGTGGGKTRIAMMIIDRLKPKKVLFLSDSLLGKEITLPDEMKKWGLDYYIPNTTFQTYQTAYKWKKETKDLSDTLVIADEIDFAMTGAYGAFFHEYPDVQLLGMTGYMPEDKAETFKDNLPVLTHISREVLQDNGIINRSRFVFVQFCLGKEKNRIVKYKKAGQEKSFTQSENDAYLWINKKVRYHEALMSDAILKGDDKVVKRCEYVLSRAIPLERMNLLFNLDSIVDIVKKIKRDILDQDPKNKVVTFSQRTAQADKLSHYPYHGKNKDSINDEIFAKFSTGKIRELALCGKMKKGANIENLTHAIFESYIDDKVAVNQRNGRMLRLGVGEVSVVYIMLPYYINENGEVKPTQAVKWARNMLTSFDMKKEDWVMENYCGITIGKIKD